ncbi:hypothetical protein Halar_1669 [halophilic archaeon DL31]|jgi:hypothetical protein|nr:hypothetical protein Halar_1669 [halophilic archaeon DL31]
MHTCVRRFGERTVEGAIPDSRKQQWHNTPNDPEAGNFHGAAFHTADFSIFIIVWLYVTHNMHCVSDEPGFLAFGAERGLQELHARAADRNVLAVLTDSTVDEWYPQWERTTTGSGQVGLIEYYEMVRGSAVDTHETHVVSDELALSTVQRPVDVTALIDMLSEHLDRWAAENADTVIFIESIETMLADAGLAGVIDLFEQMLDGSNSPGVVVSADPETTGPRAVVELQNCLGETVGRPEPPASAIAAVSRLRAEDPATFGYVQRYWREAVSAIEATSRNYPQAKQLHGAVETELSPRMLGMTLSGLACLDVLSLRGETNGPNRYACRSYDPDRAARLGLAAESLAES